ncbi:MAG TPA: hypothetical protein VK634_03560 [Reyranella sp.]|nr:hypothetical protein [Reyranella sp.]
MVGRVNSDWSAYRADTEAVYLASLDPSLLAELVADAVHAGLAGDLDSALAEYQEALRAKTGAVFEYTLMSAALKDPQPQEALYRAIAAPPDMVQTLMNVLGGIASFRSLFNTRVMGALLRQDS